MFSQMRHFVLPLLVISATLAACGENSKPIALEVPAPAPERHESVIAPEFQGHIVVSDGKREDEMTIARKGEKIRWDFSMYADKRISALKSDRCYSVDHSVRAYSVVRCMYEGDPDEFQRLFGSMSWEGLELFRSTSLDGLTVVERREGHTVYGQGAANSIDYRLITVDDASGMKVGIEFPNQKGHTEQGSLLRYKIELRDLQFTVDDNVFEIPAGYRREGGLREL